MTYHEMTTISGRRAGYVVPSAPVGTDERFQQVEANRPHFFIAVKRGHWTPEKAAALARRAGVVGDVEVKHSTADLSGKGYGGNDAAFVVDANGATRERRLTADEREYDDAADVHEIFDAIDGR